MTPDEILAKRELIHSIRNEAGQKKRKNKEKVDPKEDALLCYNLHKEFNMLVQNVECELDFDIDDDTGDVDKWIGPELYDLLVDLYHGAKLKITVELLSPDSSNE